MMVTSSGSIVLPEDSSWENDREDPSWEYHGRFNAYASSITKIIGNKKEFSPEERREDILAFIKKSYTPSIYNIETHHSTNRNRYYMLCHQFLKDRYSSYLEAYTLQPFQEFYMKIFNNSFLKKEFTFWVLDYLEQVGVDLTKNAVPKNNKLLWSRLYQTNILPKIWDSGNYIPNQERLERMLIYVFIRYLQNNPDFFRSIVQWRVKNRG